MKPYCSIVFAARNDNHGGDFYKRLKISLQSFINLSEIYKLKTEIVLVEWNPIQNKISLYEFAKKNILINKYCDLRVIRVPNQVHNSLANSKKLKFFQMIAKNVGIRRANGTFIIASNIDIILSASLFKLLAEKKLNKNCMYRSDRFDIKRFTLESLKSSVQEICKNGNLVRINRRNSHINAGEIISLMDLSDLASKKIKIQHTLKEKIRLYAKKIGIRLKSKFVQHTYACGDFTLLSKDGWACLRGYPELPVHSWHLDSVLCIQAHNSGFFEKQIPYPNVHFHLEHKGGFTPENGNQLFSKLNKRKIPFIKDEFGSIEERLKKSKSPIYFNSNEWGFENCVFSEKVIKI